MLIIIFIFSLKSMASLRTLMMNHLLNIFLISYQDTQGPSLPVYCWPWAVLSSAAGHSEPAGPQEHSSNLHDLVILPCGNPGPALTMICDCSHPALPFLNLLVGLSTPLLLIKFPLHNDPVTWPGTEVGSCSLKMILASNTIQGIE